MEEIILLDNIKYHHLTLTDEEQLEKIVQEHAADIFGKDSLYFNVKKKIKSKAGVASIPDGYLVCFSDPPIWYIIEIELSIHPVFNHIVAQANRFLNGIKNQSSLRQILTALDEEIEDNPVLEKFIADRIGRKYIKVP